MTDPFSERFELFARTRERIGSALVVALRLQLPQIAADMRDAERAADSARQIQALREATQRLEREAATRIERIVPWLDERTINCLELAGQIDLPSDGAQAWALVGNEELEARIAAAKLARQVQVESRDFYHLYAGRIAGLTQRRWQLDELMPLGASALTMAAFKLVDALSDDDATMALVHRSIHTRMPVPLAGVLRDADAHLVLQSVLPWLDENDDVPRVVEPEVPPPEFGAASPEPTQTRSEPEVAAGSPQRDDRSPAQPASPSESTTAVTTLAPDASATAPESPARAEPERALAQVDQSGVRQELPPQLMTSAQWSAVDTLERNVRSFSQDLASTGTLGSSPLASGESHRLRVLPTLQKIDEIDRDAVAFAHSVGQVPYSREARHALFDKVRIRLRENGASAGQLAELDIVMAMFDYVIDDRRLPTSARPLVWRLHQPVMALSLLDPGFLADDPRSLRRLIENFGAIAVGYSEDMVKDSELYRRLETVVRAVEIIASGLQVRSAVIAQQVEREYLRASNSVSKLVNRVVSERTTLEAMPSRRNRRDARQRPGREREREVTEQVQRMLADRVASSDAPESVSEFLQSVWARHLRTAILRDGEGSEPFRRSLTVVDDLLWTLDAGSRQHSRTELAHRIPTLINLLNVGIREVDAKDAEYKSFFDELFLIHLQRMQQRSSHRRKSTPPSTSTPSGILLPPDSVLSLSKSSTSHDVVAPSSTAPGSIAASSSVSASIRPSMQDSMSITAQPFVAPATSESAPASIAAPTDSKPDDVGISPPTSAPAPGPARTQTGSKTTAPISAESLPPATAQTAAEAAPRTPSTEPNGLWSEPAEVPSQPLIFPTLPTSDFDVVEATPAKSAGPQSAGAFPSLDAKSSIGVDALWSQGGALAQQPVPKTTGHVGHDRQVCIDERGAVTMPDAVDEPLQAQDAETFIGEPSDAAELWSDGGATTTHTNDPTTRHASLGEPLTSSFADSLDASTFADSASTATETDTAVSTSFRSDSPPSRVDPRISRPAADDEDLVPDPLPPEADAPLVSEADDEPLAPRATFGETSSTDSSSSLMPAPSAGARASGELVPVAGRSNAPDAPDHRLLEVLNSLDLSDAPVISARVDISAENAIARLQRGTWIEIRSNDGQLSEAKVAWINPRRSVVLLVRHPDRKALSLRMNELKTRFDRGRAYLLR